MLNLVKLLFCFGLILTIQLCDCSEHEKRLIHDLFNDSYQIHERPVKDDSSMINLGIGISLQQIMDVDERNQFIKSSVYMTYTWNDEYMVWDPKNYGGIEKIRVPQKKVWKPDLLLYNSVDENFDTFYPANVLLNYTGIVEWMPPGIITSTCKISITWFPFDEQECYLMYGTWTYNGLLINIHPGDVTKADYSENGEWTLLSLYAKKYNQSYACCPDTIYYDIKFYIKLRRRALYYGLNLIIPCLVMSLMTLLDFILPPDSGEKLTLGITIFMSLCVFLMMVAELLPPTSDAVPLIGVYFSSVMIIVSLTQVFSVLVLNFHNRRPLTHFMTPTIEKIFLNWLPYILMMKRPGYVAYKFQMIDENELEEVQKKVRQQRNTADCLCSSVLTQQPLSVSDDGIDHFFYKRVPVCDRRDLAKFDAIQLCTGGESSQFFSPQLQSHVNSIYEELCYINRRLDEENEEDKIINDWKFAAMVLDRLCLVVFLLLLSVSTCAILFASPHGIGN